MTQQRRVGSWRVAAPRPLARESVRQWTSGIVPLIVVVGALIVPTMNWLRLDPFDLATVSARAIAAYGLIIAIMGTLYASLTFLAFRGLSNDELRWMATVSSVPRRRPVLSRARWLMMSETVLAVFATVLSFAVVAAMTFIPSGHDNRWAATGALAAIVSCWLMMIISFATSYLREWAVHGTIEFDGEMGEIWFSDFVYVAVQMATGVGTANAVFKHPMVRRQVSVQNMLTFVFNSVIMALVITAVLPSLV